MLLTICTFISFFLIYFKLNIYKIKNNILIVLLNIL